MRESIWLALTARERTILQTALGAYIEAGVADSAALESLVDKLRNAESYPAITIGVHGGQVQWVMGNPFPIRICDYDGEKEDLPDVDERDQRCRMGYAPPDMENGGFSLGT